jgi:hypothetical protein
MHIRESNDFPRGSLLTSEKTRSKDPPGSKGF